MTTIYYITIQNFAYSIFCEHIRICFAQAAPHLPVCWPPVGCNSCKSGGFAPHPAHIGHRARVMRVCANGGNSPKHLHALALPESAHLRLTSSTYFWAGRSLILAGFLNKCVWPAWQPTSHNLLATPLLLLAARRWPSALYQTNDMWNIFASAHAYPSNSASRGSLSLLLSSTSTYPCQWTRSQKARGEAPIPKIWLRPCSNPV